MPNDKRGLWTLKMRQDIVLRLLKGESPQKIASELGLGMSTLYEWRDRLLEADLGTLERESRNKALHSAERELEKTRQTIERLAMELSLKEEALDKIHNSDGWKLLTTYYRIRDKVFAANSMLRLLTRRCLSVARLRKFVQEENSFAAKTASPNAKRETDCLKITPQFSGLMIDPDYREALKSYMQNPTLMIELSSRCNFHCPYCVSSSSMRQKGFMDRKLFEHILSQTSEITQQPLRFHVDGEPMLHPEFLDMALQANNAGHKLAIASNGSCLKQPYLGVNMDLTINISSSKIEHKKRTSIDYQLYLERIKEYLWNWKEGQSTQQIFLKVYFNENERKITSTMQEKRNFAHSLAGELGFDSSLCWCQNENNPPFVHTKNNGASLMISFQKVAEGGLYPVQSDLQLQNCSLPSDWGFCDSPWKVLSILADGSIGFCCVDITGKTAFTSPDDIWKKGLKDLWLHHSRLMKAREDFLAGKVQLPVCQKCLALPPRREHYLFCEIFSFPLHKEQTMNNKACSSKVRK